MMVAISRDDGFKAVCDFCATDDDKAELLIASPTGAHICDECIGVCERMASEREKEKGNQ